MPREVITVQVGQCGNQIGGRFWQLALSEHAERTKNQGGEVPLYDDSLSSFFRNVASKKNSVKDYDSNTPLRDLKARSILIDMEEGVVNGLLNGPIGDLFDAEKSLITDVSGAGNNWAHGFHVYGPQYNAKITECFRSALEKCDSPQCFLITQSVGGGTGSGVGSYLLENVLLENFPEIFRFVCCVTPSRTDDDVVTSPYNSMLALNQIV